LILLKFIWYLFFNRGMKNGFSVILYRVDQLFHHRFWLKKTGKPTLKSGKPKIENFN
jgi:hypothetical protein